MSRQGVRTAWSEMPAEVRDQIDDVLGSPVVTTTAVSGGFSPGPAVRAALADGRTVFVKAAGLALNPHAPGMHRREGAILAVLPASVPAPRLLGVVDDGDWVALTIEWVEGRHPDATSPADVGRLLDLVARVGGDDADAPDLAPFATVHRGLGGHWVRLAAEPLAGLDDWSRRHLDRLAELDALAPAASSGRSLVHVDLRTDNVLLAGDGPDGDRIVDWPAACLGAPWIDLVGLLPALHLDGGPCPADVFSAHALGRAADPDAVDAYLAAITGYFTRQSLLAPPPGLPTLRAFQAAQAAIARTWLAERLRLP